MKVEKYSFSAKLKVLRKKSGITQEEMAKALNISRSSYSHYENGILPDILKLKKIAAMLHVSLDVLLDNDIPNDSEDNSYFITYKDLAPIEKEMILQFRMLPPDSKKELVDEMKTNLNKVIGN